MTSVTMSDADKKVLSDFIVMNETIKRLDKDKKKLSEEVEAIFDKYHIDTVDHDGSTLTVTESVRKTVTSKKKDLFIQELVKMGKNYLIMTSLDLDTDTIYAEMQNGDLKEEFVKKYMSITPTKTLTCK